MKLNKNFVQISTTAIVTSAIFIAYILFSQKGPTVAFMKSERITWDSATKLKDEYLKFKPLRVKHKGETSTDPDKKENLQGFIFLASDLDEIINRNHSPQGNPDQVIFYFGQAGKFGDGLFNNSANLHIIALGMKGKTLLNDGTKSEPARAPASIFDKADPCPPNCPR